MEIKVGLLAANEETNIDATSQRVISSICETKFSRYALKAFISCQKIIKKYNKKVNVISLY